MSANALIVSVLFVLVVAAAAARIVTGPVVKLAEGDSLYAMGKFGPVPGVLAGRVEMAVSDAAPAH